MFTDTYVKYQKKRKMNAKFSGTFFRARRNEKEYSGCFHSTYCVLFLLKVI